jgi:hypothetical protein
MLHGFDPSRAERPSSSSMASSGSRESSGSVAAVLTHPWTSNGKSSGTIDSSAVISSQLSRTRRIARSARSRTSNRLSFVVIVIPFCSVSSLVSQLPCRGGYLPSRNAFNSRASGSSSVSPFRQIQPVRPGKTRLQSANPVHLVAVAVYQRIIPKMFPYRISPT